MDNGRVVCALLDGQICSAYFNMRNLDDFLVFVWTWTRTAVHQPNGKPKFRENYVNLNNNHTNSNPNPTPNVNTNNSNNSKKDDVPASERVSFFINAHFTSLMLDVDLAPISRLNLHIDNVVASLCPGSGRYYTESSL